MWDAKKLSSSAAALKWVGLVTAIWVQAISGNNYTFSNYSDALKSLMNLTQLQLNNLSVAKDVGKAFGLLAGLASDVIPTWIILLIGSLEGFVGYGAQWLVVSQNVKPFSYWKMCIFMCLGGNSTTWMNTAVLVTCIRNFRGNRGPVAGILKGYVGLSTAIFTDLCAALFSSDPSTFLAMLAIVPFAVCATAMVFLREVPVAVGKTEENYEFKYFTAFNTLAVVVALYLLAYDFIPYPSRELSLWFSAVLVLLLASPLSVPIFSYFRTSTSSPIGLCKESPGAADQLLISTPPAEEKLPPKNIGEEHTIWQALQKIDFWIMFSSFLCGVGTGMAVQNNMGQIGLAFGYADVSIFVSFISIWGFFGRIISGIVSEYFIKTAGVPRPIWNAASQVVMAVGVTLMAWGFPGCLYIGSILVGISYGVRLSVTVAASSELFGLKHYGMIYNILILNLPLGSFLFSGLLAGYLYDAQATPTQGGGNTCVGVHCYRIFFFIMAIISAMGCALDIWLSSRTKKVYMKLFISSSK